MGSFISTCAKIVVGATVGGLIGGPAGAIAGGCAGAQWGIFYDMADEEIADSQPYARAISKLNICCHKIILLTLILQPCSLRLFNLRPCSS